LTRAWIFIIFPRKIEAKTRKNGSHALHADPSGSPTGSHPVSSHTGSHDCCSAPVVYVWPCEAPHDLVRFPRGSHDLLGRPDPLENTIGPVSPMRIPADPPLDPSVFYDFGSAPNVSVLPCEDQEGPTTACRQAGACSLQGSHCFGTPLVVFHNGSYYFTTTVVNCHTGTYDFW